MHDDVKLEDFFNDEEVDELKQLIKAEQEVSKLHKKVRLALFDLVIIFFVPIFFNRYQNFDVIRNSTIFETIILVIILITSYMIIVHRFMPKMVLTEVKNQKRVRFHAELMDIASFMMTLLAIITVTNTFFFSLASVEGQSMEPTFYQSDDIIISHINQTYERFDVVVVRIDEDTFYVKRIIGLPGDELEIINGVVFINGDPLDEWYVHDFNASNENISITIPENSYFVLGDNRGNSRDSRDIGPIEFENLYGKVIFRVRPFSAIGRVN
ncbi:MAG: signal peptidase I [Candidatus Izemoplasmataceae bacterium]|jgi:signal peptidase I